MYGDGATHKGHGWATANALGYSSDLDGFPYDPAKAAAKLASKFVKVVLSGVGGDELFAGYPWRYYKASENKNFDNVLLINSKNYNFDLEVNNDGLINFPSKIHNSSFQGCHIIRKNSLHPYPEIFNIQDFWKDCSLNEKIYGYETTKINAHVGTKDEYLKYK